MCVHTYQGIIKKDATKWLFWPECLLGLMLAGLERIYIKSMTVFSKAVVQQGGFKEEIAISLVPIYYFVLLRVAASLQH